MSSPFGGPPRQSDPGPAFTGFEDVPGPGRGVGTPGEWDGGNLHQMEVVESRRPAAVLFFLFALVAVVLVALALAAFRVLGDGDDPTNETTAEESTTTDGSLPAVPGDGSAVDGAAGALPDDVAPTDGALPESSLPDAAPVDPNDLQVAFTENPFVCDGGTRGFAVLSNAQPGEKVGFVSPESPNLSEGTADASGQVNMRWQCDPSQAPTVWNITATGVTSARSVTFSFTGVATADSTTGAGAGADPGQAVPESGSGQLNVAIQENPFACDGEVRAFGQITGAAPNEEIRFTSPQSSNLKPGQADANGSLPIRWSCDATQTTQSWTLTATGAQSGATATFTLNGAPG